VAAQQVLQAFDRAYLQTRLDRARRNITRAAASCGMDPKTFRKHWAECGLPPLSGEEETDDA
jgi:DNA-binding protein Fis